MGIDSLSFGNHQLPVRDEAQDAEDIAAALLLREVEELLLEGQPRHAVAHIVDMTGVEPDQATRFVSDLQRDILRKRA